MRPDLQPQPVSSRLTAMRILQDWRRNRRIPDYAPGGFSSSDGMVMKLVYGVIRNERSLHWMLTRLVRDRPVPEVRIALQVGLYQLIYADDIPAHAAVNETVDAVRVFCGPRATGLANGVLRGVEREISFWKMKIDEQPAGIRYSHPDELLEHWRRAFGVRNMRLLCEWNNQPASLFARVLTRRCPPAQLEKTWKKAGVDFTPLGLRAPGFFEINHGQAIRDLPGFHEGWFLIQDPATQAALDLLDLREGLSLLDACAAPGGKTQAAFDRIGPSGTIVAVERSPARTERMRSNFQRTGLDSVHSFTADFLEWTPPPSTPQTFDRVLLDAPCSNTGVIRRKPDVRWRYSGENLKHLTDLQNRLLERAASWVAPRGLLVYSTCSLEEDENECLIQHWLKNHPDWHQVQATRRTPFKDRCDGAFAAQLKRKSA